MANNSCPYLGLENDPSTHKNFPDIKNCCFNTKQTASPSLEHQTGYCLTASHHKNCPVFTSRKPKTLPLSIRSPKNQLTQNNKLLRQILFGLLLIFLIIFIVINFSLLTNMFEQNNNQPNEINDEMTLLTAPIPVAGMNADHTPSPTSIQESACQIDPDWIEYVIKPTDSIFRISLLFNVSVEEILAANCLGENTFVAPHQIIYLPIQPTPTPTITFSPTNTIKIRYIPPTNTQEENRPPRPTKTPVPPTPFQPTAIIVLPTMTQILPTQPPETTPTESLLSTPTLPPIFNTPTEPGFPTQPNP